MTVTKSGVLLIALFVLAVWVRVHDGGPTRYPYYNDVSATRFRAAAAVAEDGRVPAHDERAWWPEGYTPTRNGPLAVEYATGQLYRAYSLVSDASPVRFAGLFTALFFSLSVFACYGIARALWNCEAAGLFAAILTALLPPLVAASDGSEFLHAPFSATIAAFGTAALVRWLQKPSRAMVVASGVAALALFTVWAHAGFYVALIAAVVLAARRGRAAELPMTVTLLVATVLAGALLPHLRSARFLATWPAIFVLVCAVWSAAGRLVPRRVPPWAWVVGATIVLAAIVRATAGEVSTLDDYWLARLRHLFGKPADPLALSPGVRVMWSQRSAPPGWYGVISLLLPLAVLAPATVLGLRRFRAETARTYAPAVAAGLIAIAAYLLDQSAVFAVLVAAVPLAGAAFFSFRKEWRVRLIPAALSVIVVVSAVVAPYGALNPGFRLTRALGGSEQADEGFLWLSLGNADQELVRHLVRRTSVRDLLLAPPRIASLMVQFAGRKLVFVPGLTTAEAAQRVSETMRSYYEDETRFYDRCRSLGVTYVVYSIDVLLDTSRYSNRYLAGLAYLPDGSVAYDMHFRPQRLRHFTLEYENDNYRVFRVTEEAEPFFLTDHPPVYQEGILAAVGGSLDAFYDRVVDALATYATARELQERGNDKGAIPRLRYCVSLAPKFTRAWLGMGDSALRLDDLQTANAAYTQALELAPDNAHALYFGAVTTARRGDRAGAQAMLEVLLHSTDDKELLQQGRELQAYLARVEAEEGQSE